MTNIKELFPDISKNGGRIILVSEEVTDTGMMPTRIVLWAKHKGALKFENEFITHVACGTSERYHNTSGHYIYDLEEAIADYMERCKLYSAKPDGIALLIKEGEL